METEAVWKSNLQSASRSWGWVRVHLALQCHKPACAGPSSHCWLCPCLVQTQQCCLLLFDVFLDKYSFSLEAVSSLPAFYFSVFQLLIFRQATVLTRSFFPGIFSPSFPHSYHKAWHQCKDKTNIVRTTVILTQPKTAASLFILHLHIYRTYGMTLLISVV